MTDDVLDSKLELEIKCLFEDYERKRLEIGDCLFSSQRHPNKLSCARRLLKLSGELSELANRIESHSYWWLGTTESYNRRFKNGILPKP